MNLLLIGPYPPPHGGISVHVSEAHRWLRRSGADCRVLNIAANAKPSAEYERVRSGLDLVRSVWRYARNGWVLHLHIHGHNRKAWLIALTCGIVGWRAPARLLTLHSGMTPAFVASGGWGMRLLLRLICALYTRIVCVSRPIQDVILTLGAHPDRLVVLPAFLPKVPAGFPLDCDLDEWMKSHRPLLSTTLFFRPEYGFDLLVCALSALRSRYPQIGCIVMGSREGMDLEKARVAGEGMECLFRFLGDVEHDVCLWLISRSDLYVRPTLKDGDSISVREALYLGVPVVASNAGVRPPSAILFEAGNVEELITKLDEVLATDSSSRIRRQVAVGESGAHLLFELYQGVCPK